jgi:hypothetical protein
MRDKQLNIYEKAQVMPLTQSKNTEVIPKSAEVAQPGRALDPLLFCSGGEAEDRVVAGSNPALGTTELSFRKEPSLGNSELSLFWASK